jgi:hypothetical protein
MKKILAKYIKLLLFIFVVGGGVIVLNAVVGLVTRRKLTDAGPEAMI